jgi:hypothetical protein
MLGVHHLIMCKEIRPTTIRGGLYWEQCTMPQDVSHYIKIHNVALGSMYPYLVVSTDIGIYDICLGINVPHWDTCHCFGIRDNASINDKDATSS